MAINAARSSVFLRNGRYHMTLLVKDLWTGAVERFAIGRTWCPAACVRLAEGENAHAIAG
ncbi:hypothetical protein [Nonomuraea sediminis]|uniref:hypothetical protein n=1 Tax=Nonomuraea sediminis TaxID=2835864 RepID=UPI001BDD3D6B|nr:hypothetical protein [Nonomuraea sediminis]